MRDKIAVIIGAGPAGLTAAYELLTKSDDIQPIILEAEHFVGGISRTATYNGNRMDIGGHRFFSKDERVTKLWTEMLPVQGEPALDDKLLEREKPLSENGPDPETTDEVMLVRDRVSRIIYKRKFFDYPISMKPQTFINMGLVKTVKAGCSYLKSTVSKKEETSLENFYINLTVFINRGIFNNKPGVFKTFKCVKHGRMFHLCAYYMSSAVSRSSPSQSEVVCFSSAGGKENFFRVGFDCFCHSDAGRFYKLFSLNAFSVK